MEYTIIYTKSFENQLDNVISYCSEIFTEEIAYNYYLEIKKAINNLSIFLNLLPKYGNIDRLLIAFFISK